MRQDIKENYDKISADHIAHWRETGENPWQDREHVEAVGTMIAEQITRYSQPGDFILDAGCGMGELLQRVPDDRLRYGVDWSEAYIEIANTYEGMTAVVGDLEAIPWTDEFFDLVVSADVLEHVVELNGVIREMLRVLRPGGTLIIRTPDEEDLMVYLAPDCPYRFIHLRRFDEASLRMLLDRIFGCEVLEVTRLNRTITVVARKPE